MIKSFESMGVWMLGKLVPTLTAAAGCPPDPYCAKCGMCHLKRCRVNGNCKGVTCGGCGYDCSASASAQAVTLC